MQPLYAGVVINKKIEATDRIYTYIVPASLRDELRPGMAVRVPFGAASAEGVVVEFSTHSDVEGLKEIGGIVSPVSLFDEDMLALSAYMSEYYLCTRAAALQAMLPAGLELTGKLPPSKAVLCYYPLSGAQFDGRQKKQAQAYALISACPGVSRQSLQEQGVSPAVLKALSDKGFIEARQERLYEAAAAPRTEEITLSDEQRQAYEGLCALLDKRDFRTALLHGVTGSGKTEIYLRLAQKVINEGRQVLILVPEIALTPQMVDFLSRRLKVKVAVLHSAMSNTERRNTWQEISEGEYSVALGARSAVFAPLHNIGLIIMDEEQESSYKQDNTPRFHARELASFRAKRAGALLLLGSATPSVESYYRADKGEYALFTLRERFYQPLLPRVEIVDMRRELAENNRSMFSRSLYTAIRERLERGEQTLLFLNRRGYYTFFSCRACGEVIKCPHCSVPLAYHEKEHKLKCHYCGHREEAPQICPHCGSRAIRHFGTGTQRVAAEAQRLFPQARILRMDRDATAQRGSHEQIYRRMRDREADILVGTQMIAKGLDFPHVTLAAVLAADAMLNLPDWRAPERAFQLLTQFIGRAGRRDKQGDAIIQTYTPDSYIIAAAARQDYEAFYEKELLMREAAYHPPFAAMISLLFAHEDEALLERICAHAAGALNACLGDEALVCGPAPAPVERLQDKWRRQILLKGGNLRRLREAVRGMYASLQAARLRPKELQILADVEPMDI